MTPFVPCGRPASRRPPESAPSRSRRWRRLLAAVGVALTLPAAHALPMASDGRWMVMLDTMPDGWEVGANNALTRQDAIGLVVADATKTAPNGATHGRERIGASYTRLVHRWNLPHAQANLWFVGWAGRARIHDAGGDQDFWSPSVLADYETTRVYTAAGWRTERSSRWQRDKAYLKAGFSFYEADYEETQPWLILVAERERDGVEGRPRVTANSLYPMLRLINRAWFLEIGANRDGLRVNLMWSR